MRAIKRDDSTKLALQLLKITFKAIKHAPVQKPKNEISATILFTPEEVYGMAEPFKQEFIRSGRVARIIKSWDGGEIFYEIRYRRNGYNVTAKSNDLRTAKRLFLNQSAEVTA